jgi:hypothetical protein
MGHVTGQTRPSPGHLGRAGRGDEQHQVNTVSHGSRERGGQARPPPGHLGRAGRGDEQHQVNTVSHGSRDRADQPVLLIAS